MTNNPDPFREARENNTPFVLHHGREEIPLILDLRELRRAAKDWQTYSNDNPFHITINPETQLRSMRQLPIETDPPAHTEWRALVEPMFRRALQPDYQAAMASLVRAQIDAALRAGVIEAVQDFSLPLQCRGLGLLLNMPPAEAERWISWGVHVFHAKADGASHASDMEAYTDRQLDRAAAEPGKDFFSMLHQFRYQGRPLTREEQQGFANLVFAGGRDTIIQTVSSMLHYFSEHPEALQGMAENETLRTTATEEFVRWVSPLTVLSRTCPHGGKAGPVEVPPGGRVGLCYASANRDAQLFPDPDEIRLDRTPNPHVGFGFGPHNCLGASHARLLIRSLLAELATRVDHLELLDSEANWERENSYKRQIGFQRLRLRFHPLAEGRTTV